MAAETEHSGRWPKGQSGNPAGRPKGAKNKASLLAEQLEHEGEPLLERLLTRALAGDSVALRFCLARLLPPAKHRPVRFDLPALTGAPAQDAANALHALLEAVSEGAMTPPEAERIAALIERRRAAQEAAANEAEIREAYARQAEDAQESLVEEMKADALVRRIVAAVVASRAIQVQGLANPPVNAGTSSPCATGNITDSLDRTDA